MSNFIKRIFNSISLKGLKEDMSMSEQKKVILTNQFSLLMFLVLFSLMTALSVFTHKFLFINFLLTFTILSIPLVNHFGLYRITSFVMSVVFPLNILIFSTRFKIDLQDHIDISYYFIPRFLAIGGIIIPLVLIDAKYKWTLGTAIIFNLICLVIIDPVCVFFGVGFNQVDIVFTNYFTINIFILFPFLLILFGFLFLQNINNKYEKKVTSLMSDLKKMNSELHSQKEHIQEIHKEVTDSIYYAKRLQQAILPPIGLIKKHLPDTFVIYNPKDIVAGDFYWMEVVDNSIFFAVADCTGHGVPGAMVSVVCSNALNRTVKEFGLRHTGKILDKVTDLVLETFEKSSSEVKDGMDISLIVYDKMSKQLQWSGANNPLWFIQNGQIREIKADKQPIGKFDNRKPFTTNTIENTGNMIFYLFTDGMPDQFGGPKGKKFLYKRLENKLAEVYKLPMAEQQDILEKTFQEWKGELEQVDDVTIIGIKI